MRDTRIFLNTKPEKANKLLTQLEGSDTLKPLLHFLLQLQTEGFDGKTAKGDTDFKATLGSTIR